MTVLANRPGISIIVTSYERMESLYQNLTSLLSQKTGDVPIEIIVVNNSARVTLRPSLWTKLGRLFRQHPEIRLINARYNWRIYFRYGITYFAYYDTILFLDDDIYFCDDTMLIDMYTMLMGLGQYDIVSCWNMLWAEWDDTQLSHVSATLFDPDVTTPIKTDTCGPGISMFNRELVLSPVMQNHLITWNIPDAGDYALGLLAHMVWGGTTYAMPSYQRVNFSKQFQQNALHLTEKNFVTDRLRLFKEMLGNGYKPVIQREPLADDSPEMQLIARMDYKSNPW
jgi:glycosyltransferase involved in cell wall biosynthesis